MSLGKAGPFELIELLGEGGVGQVYGARDPLLGRQVAIKMLRRELSGDREFLDRFYGEAQRLGDLNHANITTLYGLYFEGDKPFMVMELVRGRTLKDLLRRTRRLPPRESLAVMAQTLAGLAYAHRAWVIHRDIKPSNLMVTDGGIVKIMDFGIARVRGSLHLTRAGQAFLTPLYASPEQIKGEEVDERSDLYSLGVLFYEMLAGRPPFVAKSEYLLERAHLEDAPPPLAEAVPDLDPRIAAAVMRALAKNPAERFASAEEFGHAVGARAIRGDAPDILQEFIAATFRGAPADETRLNPRANFSRPPPVSEQAGSASSAPAPVTGANFSKHGPIVEPPKRSDGRGRARRRVALIGGIALALAAAAVAMLAWLHPPARITAAIPKAPHTTPAPPTPVALLDIRTKPSGATVRIDGAAAGAAPLLHKIPPGKHLVQASLAGYQPKSASIDLQPGQTLPVELGLTPLPAALQIRTTPSGATVRIDGAAAGAAPLLHKAPPGKHLVQASLAGYQPKSLSVDLRPDQTLAVDLQLAALPAPPLRQVKPDIEGVVEGAMSASTIKVGDRWIELYGIDDPTRELRRHIQAVAGYLAPARGRVACYRKAPGKYQCYSGGQDLALLALRDGIARLARNAPDEYRGAAPRQAPRGKSP